MNHEVYLCYSTKDRDIANQICEAIESNGVKCWIDSRDLLENESSIEQAADAIRSAEDVVLIFSKNALESEKVHNEISFAFSNQTNIIAVNIDGTSMGSDSFIGAHKPKAKFEGTSNKFHLEIPSLNVDETVGDGSASYVYLSYDDEDSQFIESQITQYEFMEVNFRHCDDSEIEDSALLVVFISKDSCKSSKIKNDVIKAISEGIGILMIHLDDSEPDFGRMFNLKYGSRFKKSIKYSIHKQKLDEITYIAKCDEIFQLFGVKITDSRMPI